MPKQMIINASAAEEIRVAIVENNRLTDLDFENQSRTKHKGNIYKGIVANVEDSLEAAFIEFGDDKQGFLSLSEVRPALYPEEVRGQKRPRISDVLKRGQEIVVQVTKDEIGQKGAAVTTYLSLPGRYVVLMHSDDGGGGISRKIDDESARRRAREMLSRIAVPEGMAVIIRTAGMNRPLVDLYRDLKALCESWEQIDRGAQLGRAPTLLYREPDLVVRTIRDYLSPDIQKIIIDSEEEYQEVLAYFEDRMPDLVDLLERHEARQPVFESFGIEKAIEDLFHREVKLPSGGYLVIDQTEALVAVDVNSGRSTKEEDHEATVYKTNLEAAAELARQLRLRDLGGIVVVDFIDMASRKHDRDVERAVKEAMRADRAKVKVGRISENGTLELTRQRLRQAHRLISFTNCPHCEGTGLVRDPEGLAVSALRQIHSRLARHAERLAKLTVRLPVPVANVLNNTKRRELLDLGEAHQVAVEIIADERASGSDLRFDEERRGRAGLEAAHAVKDRRLTEDAQRRRGRRGRKRHEEVAPAAMQATPPPSIGPVPTFLDDEEVLLTREPEPEAAPEEIAEAPAHFDDALDEALFGEAPSLSLQDVEAAAPAPAAADDEAPRKKRRRRRRRGRGERDGAAQADGEAPADLDEERWDEEPVAASGAEGAREPVEADGAEEGVAEPPVIEPPAAETVDAEAVEAEASAASAEGEPAPVDTVEAKAEEPPSEETKPAEKRARRPRSRRPRAKAADEAASADEAAASAPPAHEDASPEATAEGADEKAPRGRRRTRRAPRAPRGGDSAAAAEETAPASAEAAAPGNIIEG